MIRPERHVQGFTFTTVEEHELADRNGTICQIIGRVEEHGSLLESGPVFRIRFGDGFETNALAAELSPWFPWE